MCLTILMLIYWLSLYLNFSSEQEVIVCCTEITEDAANMMTVNQRRQFNDLKHSHSLSGSAVSL